MNDESGFFNVDAFGYSLVEDKSVCSTFQQARNSVLHIFYPFYWSDGYAVVHGNHNGSVVRLENAVQSSDFSRVHYYLLLNACLINRKAFSRSFQSTKTRMLDEIVSIPLIFMLFRLRVSLSLPMMPWVSSKPTPLILRKTQPLLTAMAFNVSGLFSTVLWMSLMSWPTVFSSDT